jgi:hypothetical protein
MVRSTVWNQRNPVRGIHAPLTRGQRQVRTDEIQALADLRPGSVTIFEDHLRDERFTTFLHHEAAMTGMEVYCRLMPAGSPPEPSTTAQKVLDLAGTYPWVRGWIPASEPNQWPNIRWMDISDWLIEFYEPIIHARNTYDTQILLFYPPMAQDLGNDLDHKEGWSLLRPTIEMFLESGDGFSWYSYWHAMDLRRLTENEMPYWLATALEDGPTRYKTLIVEAGRFMDEPIGITDTFGDEITERFGSETRKVPSRSLAHAVTFWVLGSVDPAFDSQAWIDESGERRPILDYMAQYGP